MGYIDTSCRTVYQGSGGMHAPVIYVVDLPYRPFDLGRIAYGRHATIVRLPVRDWNTSLTPWPAPRLRDEEDDFGGQASATLAELTSQVIPAIEQAEGFSPTSRAICGYSLGGLFALYAFVNEPTFTACACLSGSVWYEGWIDYLQKLEFEGTGRYAFLSVGSREKNAGIPILRTVRHNMEASAEILRARRCTVDFVVGPGNHFQHTRERFDTGITALDARLNCNEGLLP